jgi:hypothetical protein
VPDGQLRRPPQLWEQRLARTTSILGAGISSSGDATAIVPPSLPPGSGGGTEPAPVPPAAGVFKKPSTPTLIGAVQGINVIWDGLNSDGDLWPYDTSFVEVHMSTAGTGFTPGTATLKGRLARPGGLYVGGLTAGTTYHFRLRGADPAGNFTEPSNAASGLTGLTAASDYGTATIGSGAVSFNARQIGGVTNTVGATAPTSPILNDVWLDSSPGTAIIHKIWNGSTWVTNAWGSASIAAGQITALQIAAGAVTAGAISAGAITANKIQAGAVTTDKLTAGTISGFFISGGTISGGFVTGGTIEGASLRTASSGARIEMGSAFGVLSAIQFFSSAGSHGSIGSGLGSGELLLAPGSGGTIYLNGKAFINNNLDVNGLVEGDSLKISGANVDMQGVYDNNTTGIDNVGITGAANYRLRRISSSQDIKYDITPLAGEMSPSVDPDRISDVATVDPLDILNVAVTEFSVIDDGEPTERRVLGFIADDVADKLPIAVTRYDDGRPAGVLDTSLIAAVLAVVKDQAATIADLRARIEALEA